MDTDAPMTGSSSPQAHPTAHLRRSLGLWALVFYGIVIIQPTAPMPLFGVVMQEARGHIPMERLDPRL